MKKRKNTTAKIVAFIALLAIVASIIGTAAVFIFGSTSHQGIDPDITQITEEELQEYIDSLPQPETEQPQEEGEIVIPNDDEGSENINESTQ